MSLGREEMLRELELLPMWHLRQPQPPIVTELVSVAEPVTPAEVPQVAAEVFVASVVAPPDSRVVLATSPSVETEVQALPAEGGVTAPIAPRIVSPWILYCPDTVDADGQALLLNILKATQLPQEQLLLQQQPVVAADVSAQYGVLFGLSAANTFLGTQHADIAQVRGQILQVDDCAYVITHSPQAMLANPALKRQVWHDLCLLLAKNQVAGLKMPG